MHVGWRKMFVLCRDSAQAHVHLIQTVLVTAGLLIYDQDSLFCRVVEGGGGTTRHQGVEALTKSPPSPFANTRFPSPDFKSPFPPTVPPEQRPLPFSPSPFSIKQTSKQTPFQARNPPQLPLIPTSLQVPPNLPSASRLPKVSPLFQGPNLRNPGIKGTSSLNPGFQDPGSLVPGLNNPGALGPKDLPLSSISRPIFPDKQSVPFRPSPALAGVSGC